MVIILKRKTTSISEEVQKSEPLSIVVGLWNGESTETESRLVVARGLGVEKVQGFFLG